MSDNKQINRLLERLNTEDYFDRIDAIMEISSNDHDVIIEKLIEIATGAMRGEVRVAAAIGLCDHPSKKKIEFIEKYLNGSEGLAVSGGDRKATALLILASMDGTYNLDQALERNFNGKADVLKYFEKSDQDCKDIKGGIDQIAYLLAWCASIDSGYGDLSIVEYIKHKTKRSEKLVSCIIEYM